MDWLPEHTPLLGAPWSHPKVGWFWGAGGEAGKQLALPAAPHQALPVACA